MRTAIQDVSRHVLRARLAVAALVFGAGAVAFVPGGVPARAQAPEWQPGMAGMFDIPAPWEFGGREWNAR